MIGSAMVTMATELFCLNKLLENLRCFHVVFLSVDLRIKRFNVTSRDTNLKCCSNFGNFSSYIFFSKKLLFFINILFAVFNVLFVGYSLAKNNLNNTYPIHDIKKKSKTMNYLGNYINKIQSESFFVPVSVYTKKKHKTGFFLNNLLFSISYFIMYYSGYGILANIVLTFLKKMM
jgi:hypothetical protein